MQEAAKWGYTRVRLDQSGSAQWLFASWNAEQAVTRLKRCSGKDRGRSEEHTYELQSLMRISYAVFCLKKNNHNKYHKTISYHNHTSTNAHDFTYFRYQSINTKKHINHNNVY